MGIFDVVKDVAKVGAEILPIVWIIWQQARNPSKLFHSAQSRSAWRETKFMQPTQGCHF